MSGEKRQLDYAAIERIGFERLETTGFPADSLQLKGWYNATYFGTLGGISNEETILGFSLQNVVGYQFSQFFGLGLGVGIDIYSMELGERIFPLYLVLQAYWKHRKMVPYYGFGAGYGFAATNEVYEIEEAEGGLMLHPYVGIKLDASSDSHIHLDIGYKFQEAYFLVNSFRRNEVVEKDIRYKRLILRIGLVF